MDKVCEELDEAKAEIEELQAELRGKTDSLENLKKSHNAQVNQIQEAEFKIEKLDQELLQKVDEITDAMQMCEDLMGNLNNKESIIKHISAANDQLRVDCDDKFKSWEDEKRGLVLALEEVNEKTENQERQIHVYRQEIETLKAFLSVPKKKGLKLGKKSKAAEELRERDDMFQKLEEENRKVEGQLKWKKEQFKHLEEAYEKLHEQIKSCEKEWELEKSTLVSSLKIKLDSEIRISEDLQRQLQMCNEALAQEECRRKHLEVRVSEFEVQLDKVSSQYQNARLQLDCLKSQGSKDNGDPRCSLKTKEEYYIGLEYTIEKLERENQELRMSLKEIQGVEIQEAGASFSESKLQSMLRNLERIHKEYISNFKAKEAEWNFQLEKLKMDLNGCRSELETKTAAEEELRRKLERSYSSTIELKLLNEEISVMLLVLKQGISETQLKLANDEYKNMEMKNAALMSAQEEINEEREKAACLTRKVEMGSTEEQHQSFQMELGRYKEMPEESEEKLDEVYGALDRANAELDERICEGNEMEFELQIWKSTIGHLKNDIEENHAMRKELETSLLAQVDFVESLKQEKDSLVYKLQEKERRLDYLQQQVGVREIEASVPATGELETAVSSETDKVRFLQIIEEKDKNLEELQKEVFWLEQESFRREFLSALVAESSMERTNEHEKEKSIQLMNEKKMRIDEIMQQVTALEQQFTISLTSFSSQLAEKQAEINLVQEACDRIMTAEVLAALEIEEKKLMIVEVEDGIYDMQQKLKLQEEKWNRSEEQLALDIEAEMDAKQLRIKEFMDEMETKLRCSDELLQKLKMENRNLLENATRLSSERENLLGFVLGLREKILEFSTADTQLMDMLRNMVQSLRMIVQE